MSIIDRMVTLNLLDLKSALPRTHDTEKVRDSVLREVSGTLEAAGGELREITRQRELMLETRKAAEKELDSKRARLLDAPPEEKDTLEKHVSALEEALSRLDEQIIELNREESNFHKLVAPLQEIRRQATEWNTRAGKGLPEEKEKPGPPPEPQKNQEKAKTPSPEAKSPDPSKKGEATSQNTPETSSGKTETIKEPVDPFYKMRKLKDQMDAFQVKSSITEEELRAFQAEQAIAEEETRFVVDQKLNELKKKMEGQNPKP